MTKIIVNLVIKTGNNNDNSYTHLSCPQNSLLMRIVDTPEKKSHGKGKEVTRKVCKSSVK